MPGGIRWSFTGEMGQGFNMAMGITVILRGILGAAGGAITMAVVMALTPSTWAQDKLKIEAGEAVYNNYCYTCHGEKLVSSGQTFDLRRLKAGDRARFDKSVRSGKNQMPPWKDVLTSEEIDLLWHFIQANAFQK